MLKLLSMFAGKSLMPYLLGVAVLACGASYVYGLSVGSERATNKLEAVNAKLLQSHLQQRAELDAQIRYLSEKLEKVQQKEKVIYRTIKEKVAVYEKANPDKNVVCFDDASVQHINDYATGAVPDPASEHDDALRYDANAHGWEFFYGESAHT